MDVKCVKGVKNCIHKWTNQEAHGSISEMNKEHIVGHQKTALKISYNSYLYYIYMYFKMHSCGLTPQTYQYWGAISIISLIEELW